MFESEPVKLLDAELQWRTVVPKQGETVRGWVCGPLVLISCHFAGNASRPCRDKITRGGMLCYCAKEPTSTRQIGYLPIKGHRGEKLVMLMCATTARKAQLLGHGQPVEFWRPSKNNTGLAFKVIMADELGANETRNMQHWKPSDIRRYLLEVLWQDRALIEYFDKVPRVGSNLITPEPPAPSRKKAVGHKRGARDNASPLVTIAEGIGALPQ